MRPLPNAVDPPSSTPGGSAESPSLLARLPAGVAHELTNIVLALRLRADLIERRLGPGAAPAAGDAAADLAALRAAIERLAALAARQADGD